MEVAEPEVKVAGWGSMVEREGSAVFMTLNWNVRLLQVVLPVTLSWAGVPSCAEVVVQEAEREDA